MLRDYEFWREVEERHTLRQHVVTNHWLGVYHTLDTRVSSMQHSLCMQHAREGSLSSRPIQRRVTARYDHHNIRETLKHMRMQHVACSASRRLQLPLGSFQRRLAPAPHYDALRARSEVCRGRGQRTRVMRGFAPVFVASLQRTMKWH